MVASHMPAKSFGRYALCLKDKNADDLVVQMLYLVIPDERADT